MLKGGPICVNVFGSLIDDVCKELDSILVHVGSKLCDLRFCLICRIWLFCRGHWSGVEVVLGQSLVEGRGLADQIQEFFEADLPRLALLA